MDSSVNGFSGLADHEQVVLRRDRATGLEAIIAIHDTRLGPAAGGCRCWYYPSSSAALTDALRLSRGMTFKNALADIPFGGGKSVILGRQGERPSEAALRVFGRWIEELGGRYVTAEDVGMRVADMRSIALETAFVSGLGTHGFGGDPSPATALGVHLGIRAAVEAQFGRTSLDGIRVAVQGLGNVGFNLCRLLVADGAELVVADIDEARVAEACSTFGATAASADQIHAAPAEVFAPCALGGVLNPTSVGELNATVVAGSANNQLSEPGVAGLLKDRGVLYAPDYVINAGGVISVAGEYLRESGRALAEDWVPTRIASIPGRLTGIFAEAATSNRTTEQVAEQLALAVIDAGRVDAKAGAQPAVSGL